MLPRMDLRGVYVPDDALFVNYESGPAGYEPQRGLHAVSPSHRTIRIAQQLEGELFLLREAFMRNCAVGAYWRAGRLPQRPP